jgi:hypothetical protein
MDGFGCALPVGGFETAADHLSPDHPFNVYGALAAPIATVVACLLRELPVLNALFGMQAVDVQHGDLEAVIVAR